MSTKLPIDHLVEMYAAISLPQDIDDAEPWGEAVKKIHEAISPKVTLDLVADALRNLLHDTGSVIKQINGKLYVSDGTVQ